ncbi:porin [Uliginosibacterium sp. sgz301328]|uniref:porin n=1 Tax=Uliginosibacterium sp. sgz301328 TaxID=3243764 RepID=UPI00359EE850
MQKKLIAMAIAGLAAVPAFAQSNVTIYGRVDMGYRTFTNDGKATLQDEESSNRWGIQGEEDLGGGLKAFFQLENRFYLDNGNQNTTRQWKDKAWVGLKHNNLGAVSFGRVASAAYSLYGGAYEAFGGDTIGSMPNRRGKRTDNWDNAAKYESPNFGGVFKAVATLGLGENNPANNETRYGIGGQLTLGDFKAEALYQKDTLNDTPAAAGAAGSGAGASPWKTWFVTANYNFKVVEIFGGYTESKGYNVPALQNDGAKYKVYQAGFRVPVGAGTVMGNAGRITERAADSAGGAKKEPLTHYALGYWYNLSKRTILMANLSYERQKNGFTDANSATKADNSFGTEVAIRHTF